MIDRFLALLAEATKRIPDQYFQLPVYGEEDPIYRERVYTYELYHQLRLLLDADEAFRDYTLCGEIDKGGHCIFRRCAPDILLHAPGRMDNLAILEVKPINGTPEGIRKDRETFEEFLSENGKYKLGVELVYGGAETDMTRFGEAFAGGPGQIQLFWHPRPGEPAKVVPIH
jgi:hypothetical protein